MEKKEIPWHFLGLKEVKDKLLTDFDKGLEEKEINKRQKHYGKNSFEKKSRFYYPKLFWKQVKSPLVFILIIAGVITFFLEEYANTTVILIAVSINTAMGMFQEGRASKAFDKLKSSQKKYATVVREGKQKIIDSQDLVPGDIIIVQMGDQVPADSRLIEQKGLEVNESLLTGEWLPVKKEDKAKPQKGNHLSDKLNMLWMGSLVINGWGRAVVVSTGFNTEIGKIAYFIGEDDKVITPIQKGMGRLAKFLGIFVVSALCVLFLVGIIHGKNAIDMLLMSVTLAVSAIPEGLPAALTVVLAIGMQKIFSKGGLIKNLNSVETLGSTSVILTDKTGTLTKAEMQVSKIITLLSEKLESKEKEHKDRLAVLQMSLLASEAFIENPDDDLKDWIIRGDPMEKAIFNASIESGLQPLEITSKNKRLDFMPFDAEKRFTASLYDNIVYVSGAPEIVIGFCSKVYRHGKEVRLSQKEKEILINSYKNEMQRGSRVIGIVFKKGKWDEFLRHNHDKEIFGDMVLGGFIVFHDPLREDVIDYIRQSKEAFIRTVLVTGDHMATAQKIGEEVGILRKSGMVLTGDDLDKMDESQLTGIIEKVDIFARVLPHHKMMIAKAWQSKGEIVAMTGDGVNDAPALKHADIGVALGNGTDVAKEASDLILLDNSFGAIIEAVKEGRRILDNIRKVIAFLLSTSFSEIVLVGVTIFIGAPLPILPAQILWVNIVEEGFMNFAFAFEPAEKDILKRDPKKEKNRGILRKRIKKIIFIAVGITSAILLILYFTLNYLGYSIEKIRTIMFAAVAIDAIFFSFSLKDLGKPIWKINLLSNLYLVGSLVVSLVLLAGALFLNPLQKLLSLEDLLFYELGLIFAVGILNLINIELAKYFAFKK